MTSVWGTVSRGALAAALTMAAVPAIAQTAEPQQGGLTAETQSAPGGPTSAVSPDPAVSGDIIVTAQKRAENVQDVPLAVSVVTPAQLQTAGVRQFQDLNKIAPSLTIRTANQPGSANVSLRGVGTFAFGIGVEPSVAVLIDEVPLSFSARAFTDLPDVERIEVLRGPQSTLYGKSASAGLINIITREPSDELRIRANAVVTTDEEYGINGSVSGPLTDTLSYIVSGAYTSFDGNVRNVVLDREVGGRESVNLRAKLRWEPLSDVTVTLAGNYVNGDTTVGATYIELAPGARFLGSPALTPAVVFPGVTPGPNNQRTAENFLSRTDYEGGGAYLRTEVGLGDHTLVSLTSFDDFVLHDFTDQDSGAAPSAVGNNTEIGTFRSHLVTQEVRLLSPGDLPFRYTLGAYYARTRFERPFERGPAFLLANWFATSKSRQLAAFAQIDWEVIRNLTLTGGARVQNEKVGYTYTDNRANAFFSGDAEDTADTYRASARYEFTPDISAFVTYATGYKGQTYDLTSGFNAARAAAGPIRPEKSEDVELGLRTQFLNRRLTLNATYFDTSYDNLQAQTIVSVGASQTYRLTNVGGISTKGVEVDASARIGADVNLSGAVTYLDARYSDYDAASCYDGQTAAQGCIGNPGRQNLTGRRAANAPEWKFTINADYSPALTDNLRGIAQANWQYQSDIRYGSSDPQTEQEAFHIVNLGLGVRDEDRRWEVVAFVNNVFDQQYFPARLNNNAFFDGARATIGFFPRDFRRYGGVRLALNY